MTQEGCSLPGYVAHSHGPCTAATERPPERSSLKSRTASGTGVQPSGRGGGGVRTGKRGGDAAGTAVAAAEEKRGRVEERNQIPMREFLL